MNGANTMCRGTPRRSMHLLLIQSLKGIFGQSSPSYRTAKTKAGWWFGMVLPYTF